MPRGGKRTGTSGKAYSNRSDLNARSNVVPIAAATGQAYGEAGQQLTAQRAIPIAPPPAPATAAPGPAGPGAGMTPGPVSPITPLDAPTERPGEPVTAGVPVGPGPNSVAGPTGDSDLRMRLGAMYQAFPTEEIRQLIEMLDSEPS